jgi:hypothetical protein
MVALLAFQHIRRLEMFFKDLSSKLQLRLPTENLLGLWQPFGRTIVRLARCVKALTWTCLDLCYPIFHPQTSPEPSPDHEGPNLIRPHGNARLIAEWVHL